MEIGIYLWNRAPSKSTKLWGPVTHVAVEKTSHFSWVSEWVKSLSRVRLFATPWTVAHQAPLSMGFSRQEYWSGLPFISPGDLPDPRIKPRSPALQADTLTSEPSGRSSQMQILKNKLYVQLHKVNWGLLMI